MMRLLYFLAVIAFTQTLHAVNMQAERPAYARNSDSLVYHGKLVRPDDSPVTGTLNLTAEIYSPEPSLCLLWSESQTVQARNGGFSVELGYSNNRLIGPNGGAANSFREVFINNPGLSIGAAQCAQGTSYSPGVSDDRLLKVTFVEGGQTITVESIPIKSVPFAKQAQEIGGYGINNLVKVSGAGSASVVLTPDDLSALKVFSTGAPLTMGSGDQILGVKADGSAVEYKTLSAGSGITLSHSAGGIQINAVTGGVGTVTSVGVSGLPLSVTAASSTPMLSIAQANGSQAGYLSSSDWTAFNSKQPAGAYITGITAPMIETALGFTPMNDNLPNGQLWIGNGANKAAANWIGIGQLRNGIGSAQFPSACTSSQTLTWSAVTDVLSCTNISVSAGMVQAGLGYTPVNRAGDSMSGALTLPTNGLSVGTNQFVVSGGNVGIGGSSPTARLNVIDTTGGANHVVARFTGSGNSIDIVGNDGSGRSAIISPAIHGATGATGTLTLQNTDGNSNHSKIAISTNDISFDTTTASTAATRLTIKGGSGGDSGNVGIGTTSPGAKLEIAGQIKITGGSPGAGKVLQSDATGLSSWATIDGAMVHSGLGYTPVNRAGDTMTGQLNLPGNGLVVGSTQLVLSGGNVGIGMTNPQYPLDVTGTTGSSSFAFRGSDVSTPILMFTPTGGGTGSLVLRNSGTTQIQLASNGSPTYFTSGNVGIGTSSPFEKLDVSGNIHFSGYMSMNNGGAVLSTPGGGVVELGNSAGWSGTKIYAGATERIIASGSSVLLKDTGTGGLQVGASASFDGATVQIRNDGSGVGVTDALALTNFNTSPGVGTRIVFSGADSGSNASRQSAIESIKIANVGAGLVSGAMVFKTANPSGALSEGFRVDTNGNVGIGTTSPSEKLEVNGHIKLTGANSYLNLGDRNTIYAVADRFYITDGGPTDGVKFSIQNATGNVGIGTHTPNDKLEVWGRIRATHVCAPDGTNCKDTTQSWNGGGGTVTEVSVSGAPLSVTNGSSTPQISISQANTSNPGFITAADWTTFNNKLSSINGAQVTSALTYTPISSTLPSGQVYIGNGSNVATASWFGIGQMRNNIGTAQFPTSCTSSQTLTWSAVTDVLSCTNIGSLPASAISSGTIDIARLPFGASLWQDAGSSKIHYSAGNVGIGTTTPNASLHVFRSSGIVARFEANSNNTVDFTGSTGSIQHTYNGTDSRYMLSSNGAIDFSLPGLNTGGALLLGSSSTANSPIISSRTQGLDFFMATERTNPQVRIDAAGKVGIGTPSPLTSLHVVRATAGNSLIVESNAGNSGIRINSLSSNQAALNFSKAGDMRWAVRNEGTTESGSNAGSDFVIDRYDDSATYLDSPLFIRRSSGHVGVGTTSPGTVLEVNGLSRFLSKAGSYPTSGKGLEAYFESALDSGVVQAYDRTGSAVKSLLFNPTGGYVGIGTTSPISPLDLAFSNTATSLNGAAAIRVRNTDTTLNNMSSIILDLNRTTPGRFTGAGISTQGAVNAATADMLFWTNNATSLAERMRLTSTGSLGIGTNSPTATLDVVGNIQSSTVIKAGTTTGSAVLNTGTGAQAGYLAWFKPDGTTRMGYMGWDPSDINLNLENGSDFVVSNGEVGIGETSPASKLHIKGGANSWTDGITLTQTGASGRTYALASRESGLFGVSDETAGAVRLVIDSSGNTGIGNVSSGYKLHVHGSVAGSGAYVNLSDSRLKTNVRLLENSLEKLMELRGVTYDWNNEAQRKYDLKDKHDLGVIAQEVEKVFPEAVSTGKDGIKSVAYSKLIAPIIESLRELLTRILGHDQRIEKLESDLDQIKRENQLLREAICESNPATKACRSTSVAD